MTDLADLDLFTDGDPHEAWRALRRDSPVHWNPAAGDTAGGTGSSGFWALTRYQDVHDAYVDAALFSSRWGTVMGGSHRRDADSASGRMLIASDDPQHRLMRQQVHKAFLPALMDRARRVVRDYVDAALGRMLEDGGGDFATDVAPEPPAGLLAAMFGLGRTDALHLLALTRSMIGYQDPRYHSGSTPPAVLVSSQVEIFDLMMDLMETRRRAPSDDLVSILLGASVNGRPFTEDEVLYNCLNVAVGGNETTPFTASAAVQAFIDSPGQARLLRDDPGLLATAVEEVFRWTSTNAYVQRVATRDVELHGQLIRAGDAVTLWNASANRDEEKFPDADRFDVRRTPNRHIAFGVGVHRCIGMGAAQMEIGLLLREIARRGISFEAAGPPDRLRSNFMLGLTRLPVRATVSRDRS
ncbi:cytochrome P450 [Streptomyces genisteinicus]|uniref:Cytochrome P450 n=1 Tax=Streptomyces genisteinicus TaxID=2768068 RepID=A0A7H0I4E5_9ACTN|nr:cytochrome P450 [Streptomyces genisteinicus]